MSVSVRNHTSLIEHSGTGGVNYLITDRPTDSSIDHYVLILKQNHVKALVRVCEPSYDIQRIQDAGFEVHDWGFVDGDAPPQDVIDKWLQLSSQVAKETGNKTIAVHCVAGLGRAPIMVAISLIASGMPAEDAVEFIRSKRKGALNTKQMEFLIKNEKELRKKAKKLATSANGKPDCVIS